MKAFNRILVVSLSVGLALLTVGLAQAQTRTSTPTATSTATETPAPTATVSPAQPAHFRGSAWVDARPSAEDITAKIGDVVCGTAKQQIMADAPNRYDLTVVPESVTAGCGRDGAVIAFFIGGREVSQRFAWRAGSVANVDLIAGPQFAYIIGNAAFRCPSNAIVAPYINDVSCGYTNPFEALLAPCSGNSEPFSVIVYSSQQQAGCGVEGSEITFKFVDAQGNVVATANEKGVWHAWDGTPPPQQLNLTFAPTRGIKLGNVGDGTSQTSDSDPSGLPIITLFALGLIGLATGATLRRWAKL